MPTVSVVIPAFNQAHFLGDAIESVLAQRVRAVEIIVVDDGSTDATPEVARRYGDAVRYLWQENQGLAGARNTGIRAARAPLIALLDSDDVWEPTFLERMLALAAQQPGATVYYCGVRYVDERGEPLPQAGSGRDVPPEHLYRTLLRANFLVPSTILMRRDAVLAASGFDPHFRRLQDWELWLRLLQRGHHFAGTAENLVRYRLHGSSLSTDPAGGQRAARDMVEKLFGAEGGDPATWPWDKRRAYGGLYRYHVLTSLQYRQDWAQATRWLRHALRADPSLADDLDFFYELALGAQPLGQRGTDQESHLDASVHRVEAALAEALSIPSLASLRRPARATAHRALALAAYERQQLPLARRLLVRAARERVALLASPTFLALLLRSCLGADTLHRLRRLRVTLQKPTALH